ncbi:MAG: thermonuclease family protein [Deltaproteobacteria bacterium]|nr:thermonuclease family protein [Deltaproteobacteria bacterium]
MVYVIDGDTVVIKGGDKVRYLGIDAPEKGEPFYEEAARRNAELVDKKVIRLEVCKEQERDKYGRLLAYVYADKTDVGAALLREGLARQLTIPPCGTPKAAEFKDAVASAMNRRAGLWARDVGKMAVRKTVTITPAEALGHVGEVVTVTGVVADVHKTGKVAFINFSPYRKRSFTAVVFRDGLEAFTRAGIDPVTYTGKRLSVTGRVREYNGAAEIVVNRPDQVR